MAKNLEQLVENVTRRTIKNLINSPIYPYSEGQILLKKEKKSINEGLNKTYPTKKTIDFIKKQLKKENFPNIKIDCTYDDNEDSDIAVVITVVINGRKYTQSIHDRLTQLFNTCGYYLSIFYRAEGTNNAIFQFEPKFRGEHWSAADFSDYLYHITTKQNYEKIKRIGFIPKSRDKSFNYPPRCYFFTIEDIDFMVDFMFKSDKANDINELIVITVDTNKINDNIKFWKDQLFYGEDIAIYTYENIPNSAIVNVEDIPEEIKENRALSEQLINEIIDKINEDRGISDIVNEESDKIYQKILDSISSTHQAYRERGYIVKSNSFKEDIFGEEIEIYWEAYDFPTHYHKKNAPIGFNGSTQELNDGTYRLKFIAKGVKGDFHSPKLKEIIQHEMHHLWEIIKRGTMPKNLKLYDFGRQLLKSKSQFVSSVGTILYFSKKFEHNAYANGAYKYLMDNYFGHKDFSTLIKETQLFLGLEKLKKAVGIIQQNENSYEKEQVLNDLYKKFSFRYNDLIEMGKRSIDNLTRTLGRTLSKANDDVRRFESPRF